MTTLAERRRRQRDRLAEAQNWRCAYRISPKCPIELDVETATIEHVIPRRLGGPNTIDNKVVTCWHCNTQAAREVENMLPGLAIVGMAALAFLQGLRQFNESRPTQEIPDCST
jgi:hypothetical protein